MKCKMKRDFQIKFKKKKILNVNVINIFKMKKNKFCIKLRFIIMFNTIKIESRSCPQADNIYH